MGWIMAGGARLITSATKASLQRHGYAVVHAPAAARHCAAAVAAWATCRSFRFPSVSEPSTSTAARASGAHMDTLYRRAFNELYLLTAECASSVWPGLPAPAAATRPFAEDAVGTRPFADVFLLPFFPPHLARVRCLGVLLIANLHGVRRLAPRTFRCRAAHSVHAAVAGPPPERGQPRSTAVPQVGRRLRRNGSKSICVSTTTTAVRRSIHVQQR